VRLVGHPLPAARREWQRGEQRQHEKPRAILQSAILGGHSITSSTDRGWRSLRKVRVAARSNFGSVASMHTKNRSRDARSNAFELNSGWLYRGSPQMAKRPNSPVSAVVSTIISKVMGTNDGHEKYGRPPMFSE